MQMEVGASEESSNVLCGQIVENTGLTSPNLELSLPSSSVSSSNFHGEGASLYLSLSPSHTCMEGEALSVDPMITEQQDTETIVVDHSLSP